MTVFRQLFITRRNTSVYHSRWVNLFVNPNRHNRASHLVEAFKENYIALSIKTRFLQETGFLALAIPLNTQPLPAILRASAFHHQLAIF
jgi:hypothetical protein